MACEQPGEEHSQFMQWAVSEGIEINGIAPAVFPNKGLGMVATRAIEEDEVILDVPTSLMLTIDCIPPSFINRFRDGTAVQAILAAYLIHGDPETIRKWDAWRKAWPTRRSFEDSLPILWPEPLQASSFTSSQDNTDQRSVILPPAASGLWNTIRKEPDLRAAEHEAIFQNILPQQQKRLRVAWEDVSRAFPETDWDTFSHYWLIVNSRSFYYVAPEEDPPKDWNDALGLVPFADYFNHLDDPVGAITCEVAFSRHSYSMKATQRIEKGEEVHISYGSHPSDFLLVEYGFFPDDNPSDAVYLDDIILQQLTETDKENLELRQLYGDYQITPTGASTRVEAVACMKYMDHEKWLSYILGESDEGVDQEKTAEIICGWIALYLNECKTAVENIDNILAKGPVESGHGEKISTVRRRWVQIERLCQDALGVIRASEVDEDS